MIVTESTNYTEVFERWSQDLSAGSPEWLRALREAGLRRFQQVGFPTNKWEDWRFTPVSGISQGNFQVAPPGVVTPEVTEAVAQASLSDMAGRLVFINGQWEPRLSKVGSLPTGIRVGNLAVDLESDGAVSRGVLGRQASVEHSPFTALNDALFRDGAVLDIADSVELDAPLQLLFVTSGGGEPAWSTVRNVVRVGRNSRLKLIETHVGAAGEAYLSNSVTEIELGDGAELAHHKLQVDSIAAYHIASAFVSQATGSRYSNHYFAFGGALSRNEIHCYHTGENVESVLHGLYLVSGSQLADCRTRIDHAMPNCTSHEVYKGILDNRARGVFNGKIHVHPDAQKTDAKQSNQALLLSDDAVIDTKPELEIYADDVRCTHGATVGELDPQAMFYLRSRGIPETLARKMLIFAFANDVVQGVSIEPLKRHLESVLLADHGLPGV